MWKKGKSQFKSNYLKTAKDRVFTLTDVKTGRVISLESWQAAKKLGYEKVRESK